MVFTVLFKSITGHSYCPNYNDLLDGISAYDKAVELGYKNSIEELIYNIELDRFNLDVEVDYNYAKESGKFKNNRIHTVWCKNGILNKFISYYLSHNTLVHYVNHDLILNEWKYLGYIDTWKL